MAVFISFLLVLIFGVGAYAGVHYGLQYYLGIIIPYAAVAIFVLGFVYRILNWARSPVPFRIPTTAGQQKSLDWIKHNPVENPYNNGWTVVRMLLEVLTFRSLFRNTQVKLHHTEDGPRVSYASEKWLWLFAILFHYCFLVIFLRHFRFFMEPVPFFVNGLEFLDGLMQVGVPRLFMSSAIIVLALLFLLGRRFFNTKVRYISMLQDYFPLFLILGIVGTGIWMRYFAKTDIAGVKVLTMSLVSFKPVIPEGIGVIFYIHLFLVCALLIYFPFSKLMHFGGVFLSPTRNMPNDTRIRHHENPWNPPKKYRTYAEYEDEFRDHMYEAGLPLEKLPESAQTEAAEPSGE